MRTTFNQLSPLPERLLRAALLPQRLPRQHAPSILALAWFHNNVPAATSNVSRLSCLGGAGISLLSRPLRLRHQQSVGALRVKETTSCRSPSANCL